jgi:hypothetical protein
LGASAVSAGAPLVLFGGLVLGPHILGGSGAGFFLFVFVFSCLRRKLLDLPTLLSDEGASLCYIHLTQGVIGEIIELGNFESESELRKSNVHLGKRTALSTPHPPNHRSAHRPEKWGKNKSFHKDYLSIPKLLGQEMQILLFFYFPTLFHCVTLD